MPSLQSHLLTILSMVLYNHYQPIFNNMIRDKRDLAGQNLLNLIILAIETHLYWGMCQKSTNKTYSNYLQNFI